MAEILHIISRKKKDVNGTQVFLSLRGGGHPYNETRYIGTMGTKWTIVWDGYIGTMGDQMDHCLGWIWNMGENAF